MGAILLNRLVRLLSVFAFLFCLIQFVLSMDVGETALEKGYAESGVDWVAKIESLSPPLIVFTALTAILAAFGFLIWAIFPALAAIVVRVIYNLHTRSYFNELESLVSKIESRPERTISDTELLIGDSNLVLMVAATLLLLVAISVRFLKATNPTANATVSKEAQ